MKEVIFASRVPSAEQNLDGVQAAGTRAILTNALGAGLKDRDIMGEVAAKLKIMPSGMDVDMNKLKDSLTKAIPQGVKLHGFAEEPIAFGLKALIVVVKVGDVEGGTEKVEEAFSKVKGVESVNVVELGRL